MRHGIARTFTHSNGRHDSSIVFIEASRLSYPHQLPNSHPPTSAKGCTCGANTRGTANRSPSNSGPLGTGVKVQKAHLQSILKHHIRYPSAATRLRRIPQTHGTDWNRGGNFAPGVNAEVNALVELLVPRHRVGTVPISASHRVGR